MREQIERRPSHHDRSRHDDAIEAERHAPDARDLKHDLDEILDEIDELLEQNAEEFVKGFVQKGGQ